MTESADTKLALVNNEIMQLDQASISLSDNGYLLGDGVFETMRTKSNGQLLRADLHLARAKAGLKKLLIDTPIDEQFIEATEKLRSAAVDEIGHELYVRINISTGDSKNWTTNPALTITGIAHKLPALETKPLSCQTWKRFGQMGELNDVKSLSYARSAILRRKVVQSNVDDIIIISPDNHVVEASMSNLVARLGNTIYAPGTESGALPGVTRQILIDELKYKPSYEVKEHLELETLYECDEVMLTSSISGVRKVSSVDSSNYKSDKLFTALFNTYNTLLNN